MRLIVFLYLLRAVTCDITLNILHLNDLHARFEETNIISGRCGEDDKTNNACYGGLARINSKVSQLRESLENTLFLAGGDYFQGTVWYAIHKWKAMAYFLNLVKHDAMVLGNHEFDDGVEGLVPFLDNVTFPVIAANIDASLEPTFMGKITPSLVKTFGGQKVGIIGYITTETEFIANPGKLKFLDEVHTVRQEAQRLKSEGVNIIIALGHAGFAKDRHIAEQVEEVDVVVGGHTNTFLYTGDNPSTESSVGDYPTVVTQSSGKKVLIVQAYAFGKYLGHLQVTFSNAGEVKTWSGNPILLDGSIAEDQNILDELIPWKKQIAEIVTEPVGRTYVLLDGDRFSCRMKECNLGNLETDAIVHQNAKYPDDLEWAHTSLAVTNGGSIRASLDEKSTNGSITLEDIMVVAPFENTIDIVELKGKHVKDMFEASVGQYDLSGINPPGGFLQVSGFNVVYNLKNPVGSRVVKLLARCIACRIPILEPINDDEVYKIAMPAFIANGGDGYEIIRENKIRHHLTGLLDSDIFSQYIRLYSPIYQGVENRIRFVQDEDICIDENCINSGSNSVNDCIQATIATEYTVSNSGNTSGLNILMTIVLILTSNFIK